MLDDGHVSKDVYNQLGFPPGFIEDEEGVDRSVGIERKYIQQAKILAHKERVMLRNAFKERRAGKRNEVKNCTNRKTQKHVTDINDGNQSCEQHLLSLIDINNETVSKRRKKKKDDATLDRNIKSATIRMFSKCTTDELKVTNEKWNCPLKGSFKESDDIVSSVVGRTSQEDNLTALAYKPCHL
eukprot:9072709-Ditylum_brightwellii.AAC.1